MMVCSDFNLVIVWSLIGYRILGVIRAPGARQTCRRDLQEVQLARTRSCLRFMLPSDMTMSTDIQVAFSFVSSLDICLTSFGDARTLGTRNADQTDYGPLNPASLRLGLTLCNQDLPRELTDYRELTDIRN
ncbi:hypothetical protein L3X38_033339 [Prunus dulcis]|uniref:Uncharacterized protein n=1 Tax=Prunus dulcis TaxID=3755 RepID=A0AAD4VGU6_PRUDU|nr:hypothetical protein L3X38_033339 [Prunus dulcis]